MAAAQSRLAELEAVAVPVLVVQGTRDRFGMPPEKRAAHGGAGAEITACAPISARIGEAVGAWLHSDRAR